MSLNCVIVRFLPCLIRAELYIVNAKQQQIGRPVDRKVCVPLGEGDQKLKRVSGVFRGYDFHQKNDHFCYVLRVGEFLRKVKKVS